MRRPVKPFVTEYKGNARRPPQQSIKLEEDLPPPRLSEPSRFVSVSQSEDSYEAALRAADALFSGQKRRDPTPDVPADVGHDGGPSPSSAPAGRILRVIDEAPPQDMVALEAERAPKRRGRKPGSKNKPKIVQIRPSDVPEPRIDMSPPIFAPMTLPALVPHANPQASMNIATAAETASRPTAIATGVRRGERYAWVRTQLKPGQSWKRHLPKVIW